jgi:uncharacterized protein (TIGR00725 family)
VRIGVMGSAGGDAEPAVAGACRTLGRAIAERGCCLLTGACPGLPHDAVLGAKESGGHVVGISPASTLKEHVETYASPYREYDVLLLTGMGLMGRELINIHSSDIVVIVGGRSGTLGEFAIAYEQGKLIGVLKGSGGITPALPTLEARLAEKNTGAHVLYDVDPVALLNRLLNRYVSGSYVCPCYPENLRTPARRSGALKRSSFPVASASTRRPSGPASATGSNASAWTSTKNETGATPRSFRHRPVVAQSASSRRPKK